jgi:hypothetical protein
MLMLNRYIFTLAVFLTASELVSSQDAVDGHGLHRLLPEQNSLMGHGASAEESSVHFELSANEKKQLDLEIFESILSRWRLVLQYSPNESSHESSYAYAKCRICCPNHSRANASANATINLFF